MNESIWKKDITHHMLITLAVFGLVVSASVTTMGVAMLGVETQVAFAQNEATISQTAAALLGINYQRPSSPADAMRAAAHVDTQGSSIPAFTGTSTPALPPPHPGTASSTSPTQGTVRPPQPPMPPPASTSTTTPRVASSTPPVMPFPKGYSRPSAPTITKPVSLQNYEGASSAAAVVDAMNEIGDGYNKLLGATLQLLGL